MIAPLPQLAGWTSPVSARTPSTKSRKPRSRKPGPFDVSNITRGAVSLAGRLIAQVDGQGTLAASLEGSHPAARRRVRRGRHLRVDVGALLIGTITNSVILGGVVFAFASSGREVSETFRSRRRKALSRQLPDALSLIASSLSAGHTFLRAIQMMCEEADPPLADEFGRVVFEVRLGAPLVDALSNMAERVGVADLAWVVQAIRIQQTVGGKLADLLHTLADFIRARDEVRREVSAHRRGPDLGLGARRHAGIPAGCHPDVQPGLRRAAVPRRADVALGFTVISICIGVGVIFKMVKIEV